MAGKGKAAAGGAAAGTLFGGRLRVRRATLAAVAVAVIAVAALGAFAVLRRVADDTGKRLEMQRTLEQFKEIMRKAEAERADGDALADADFGADAARAPANGAQPSDANDTGPGTPADSADAMQPAEARAAVERAIKDHDVVVFSKTYCPYCKRAKETLGARAKDAGVAGGPHVVELDTLPGDAGRLMQEALRDITGQATVPNVFIRGAHVGGSDDVADLDAKGRLVPVLAGEAALS